MFYVDFLCYKKYARSLTGMTYTKLPFGPVPDDYEEFLKNYQGNNNIKYEIIYDGEFEKHIITSNQKYDTSLFSNEENEIINTIIDKFKNYTTQEIIDYSHKEKAFLETKNNKYISYEYALDLSIN